MKGEITKEAHRDREKKGGMRHTKKADGKVTETKDRHKSCLKGSRVSH